MRVDPRAGSGPLFPALQHRGIPGVHLGPLDYGDMAIVGNGPEGCPVSVGVEYKKLPDLIQCIDNGRFVGHQLPGMLAHYNVIWLLVEGIWRERSDGIIEAPRGQHWSPLISGTGKAMASSLEGFLLTMEQKVGIKVMRTGTASQTVDWLYHMNRWWTHKDWEEHRAHLAFDNSSALALIRKPNLVRRVAKELPGVGMGRSGPVAKHFRTVLDMAVAGAEEWEGIEGIGKVTAQRVVKMIQQGEGE